MPCAYVALGSNLGDRERTLVEALDALRAEDGVEVVAVSHLIETEPVGYVDQPPFLNGVAALETTLPPRELLDLLLDVERRFGRVREGVPAQGPRITARRPGRAAGTGGPTGRADRPRPAPEPHPADAPGAPGDAAP